MLPYSEGTVFLVPLQTRGFARGIVARASTGGRILFGYFFGPQIMSADSVNFSDLRPANAVLRVRFGDLGLINGDWPIHSSLPSWNRADWPMPDFVRIDLLGKRNPVRVRYSDTEPDHIELETSIADSSGLQPVSLSGSGAVEIKLTKLLDQ